MATIDVTPKTRLHDLLELRDHPDGLAEVRKLAALRGGLDGKSVLVLDRAVADWSIGSVGEDLEQAFALDPFEMMAKGWTQVSRVRTAVRSSLGPPASSASAILLQHDLDAKIKPRLVLTVAGVDWCDVEFELKLALAIESAELELYGGALRAVKLGKVTGSLTLSCQGTPIPAFEHELRFKSKYLFDPPILSAHTPAAASSVIDEVKPA